jgi:hypothetical protein
MVKPATHSGWRKFFIIHRKLIPVYFLLLFCAGWLFPVRPPLTTFAQQPEKKYKTYLPLVLRTEFQSGPEIYTTSYYMKTVDPNASYNLGCTLGARDANLPGYQDNIVVLDYGRSIYDNINGQMAYGTRLFITATRASLDQIAVSAEKFGEGYYICTGEDTLSRVKVAIGTNNYEYEGCSNCSHDYNHGAAFAKMVNAVNDWFLQKGYTVQASAAGANDLELSWNTYERTKSWLDGYDSTNQYEMYNFGAIPGCPYFASPNAQCGSYPNLWSKEQVWYVIYGSRPVYPVPEIYAKNGVNAQQWYLMSVYSYTAHGLAIEFPGVMTQWQSCLGSNDPECAYLANTPLQGWTQLQTLLSGDPRVYYWIHWVTDIKYQ